MPFRFPPRNTRVFQYNLFKSSMPGVNVRCRDWCIRSTLFMHSTALLARTVPRSTAAWRYHSRQLGSSFWHISGCTKVGHMPGTGDRPRDEFPRPLPAQPPQVHQGLTQFLGDRNARQRGVHPVQEREARRGSQVVDDPYPGPTCQRRQGRCDLGLGPGSIVELAVGPEHRQRQCGMLPSRLDRLVASEALDHLDPGATRLAGGRPGVDPRSSGSSELILGLIKGLPVPLHGVPVDGQGLPGLMLGVEDVQGRSQGSLALLTPLLLGLGDPRLQIRTYVVPLDNICPDQATET